MTLCNSFLLKTPIFPHSHFLTRQFSTSATNPKSPFSPFPAPQILLLLLLLFPCLTPKPTAPTTTPTMAVRRRRRGFRTNPRGRPRTLKERTTYTVCHMAKNYLAHILNTKVPLILGIWGGKGQGKSFQTELIFQAMGVEPVIMSAGELESERAGEPGKLIRERYRTASQVIQNQGKMSCLMINDIDAGLGRFGNTQVTVNNQIVVGTLMNLCDNPTRFYWQPNREDIINIVNRMYEKDGISRDEVVSIVDTFPNQALDFYGALRSRTYDRSISKWIDDIGGVESLGNKLLKRKKNDKLPVYTPPKQTVEALLESGFSLIKEQQLIMETKLSKEYMKNMED
ncbi:hypothetical protein M0R45_031302 [Rubus argutus]|uniref:Ribulose bisphosphate carboxylase/oxygenase activase, chloroplastic n=1 Tax=Rubus argutus TaxID=59490 RepID=A0AAW1WHU3_RUBAR